MMIKFVCNNIDCNNSIDKLFKKHRDIPPFLDCGACGTGKMERQLGAPTSKSTQFLDNGAQIRRVEVTSDVVQKEQERLYKKEQ